MYLAGLQTCLDDIYLKPSLRLFCVGGEIIADGLVMKLSLSTDILNHIIEKNSRIK